MIPDHAHMGHIVIVTGVFGATIGVGLYIQSANGGGDRGWRGGGMATLTLFPDSHCSETSEEQVTVTKT